MIDPPRDSNIRQAISTLSLDCGDLSALVAFWVLKQNLNNARPVYIVTLENKEIWSHTVCEVKG